MNVLVNLPIHSYENNALYISNQLKKTIKPIKSHFIKRDKPIFKKTKIVKEKQNLRE